MGPFEEYVRIIGKQYAAKNPDKEESDVYRYTLGYMVSRMNELLEDYPELALCIRQEAVEVRMEWNRQNEIKRGLRRSQK